MSENKPTASVDRIPLGRKIIAGAGEAVINVGINMPKTFGFVIYNLVLGVDAVLLGVVLAIPRLWDGLIDPIMGSISDNTKSKWGRRRPYMLVGGILSAAGLALICVPPTFLERYFDRQTLHGFKFLFLNLQCSSLDWAAAGYFIFISIVFYTFLTVYSVPYGALMMEMTSDYHERTRLMTFRTTFTYISSVTFGWILYATKANWFVELAERAGAEDPIKRGEVYGTWAVGLVMGLLILIAALIPTLFLKEPFQQAKREQEKVPLWLGMKETLRQGSFVLICAAYTLAFFGVIMVNHLGQYISIYFVHAGDKKDGFLAQSWAQTIGPFIGLLTVLILNRLSGRVEKKIAWAVCLGVSLLGAILTWFLYTPQMPFVRHVFQLPFRDWVIDLYFHPLAIAFVLLIPGMGATLVLSYSMIADVCDVDELATGKRREGMYWAVFNWLQKTALSLALLMTGSVLQFARFDETLVQQSDECLRSMRIWYSWTQIITIGAAMLIALCIPLTEKRLADVRKQLELRRGRLGGT